MKVQANQIIAPLGGVYCDSFAITLSLAKKKNTRLFREKCRARCSFGSLCFLIWIMLNNMSLGVACSVWGFLRLAGFGVASAGGV